jgi:CheY-like chemotaxis protein
MAPLRNVLELILTVLRSGAIQKSAPQAAFKRRTMSIKPKPARSDKPASPATIVVVDDSKDNRDLYRQALQHQGYEVLFAASGENALQLCRMHKGVIHLIVIDVVMPGMSGLELATKLLPLRPDLKVLFVSAFVQQTVVQSRLRSVDGYLAKPFPSERLVAKVQEMLAA